MLDPMSKRAATSRVVSLHAAPACTERGPSRSGGVSASASMSHLRAAAGTAAASANAMAATQGIGKAKYAG